MTRSGWARYDELSVGDPILTLNPVTNVSEWQSALAIIVVPGPHEMRLLQNTQHSSLTTMDHRWIVDRYDSHHRQYRRELRTTGTLRTATQIIKAASCASLPARAAFDDDFVELAAWIFTEGHFETGRRAEFSTLTFGQSHAVNPAYCEQIRLCLNRFLGAPGPLQQGCLWSEQSERSNGMLYWRICRNVTAEFREIMEPRGKVPSWEFLLSLTQEQLVLFVETAISGDGSRVLDRVDKHGYRRGVNKVFTQVTEARTRAFEFACILAGSPVNFIFPTPGCGQFICSLSRNGRTNPLNPQSGGRGRAVVRTVVHDGIAWCPTTTNGTWLASRKGKVYFTGA